MNKLEGPYILTHATQCDRCDATLAAGAWYWFVKRQARFICEPCRLAQLSAEESAAEHAP